MRGVLVSGIVLTMVVGLAGCGNGQSAVETRDRAAASTGASRSDAGTTAERGEAALDPAEPVALHSDGKPAWAASRRGSARSNATKSYERNGRDFGARSQDDFIDKAHAFVSHPPAGTETAHRANGDTLYYNAGSNTFAVATRDGAPRTMFKPDEGAAYWARQKAQAARSGQRARRGRSTSDAGDN